MFQQTMTLFNFIKLFLQYQYHNKLITYIMNTLSVLLTDLLKNMNQPCTKGYS